MTADPGAVFPIAELQQTWPAPSHPRPIVIVGAGGIVDGAHLPAYRMAGLPVAGVVDLDRALGILFAGDYAGALTVEYEGHGGDPWAKSARVLEVTRELVEANAAPRSAR